MKAQLRAIVFLCFVMLLLALIYTSLASCTKTVKNAIVTHDTIEVIKVTTDTINTHHGASDTIYQVKTDTIVKTVVKRDSIAVRDSVFVKEKGDSVYVYKEKWRTKYITNHDTIYKVRTDTIYKVKTDTVRILRFLDSSDSIKTAATSNHEVVKEKTSWRWWHTAVCIFWVLVTIFGGMWAWRKFGKD